MIVVVWFFRLTLAVMLLLSVNGCVPASQGDLNEEKEPHFLAGKNAVNSMDYRGAIEEFEKALEVNPRNSKAHSQLGWLYEEKELDAAAAIYHYEKYLKLRPESGDADLIRQRITNCRRDLAKTDLPLSITPGMQRQIDQILDENKRLKEENEKWKAAYLSIRPQTVATSSNVAPFSPARQPVSIQPEPETRPNLNPLPRETPRVNAPRTHVVRSGETLASIARRYNVNLSAMTAANPRLDPRRMRVGQVVNVPASN